VASRTLLNEIEGRSGITDHLQTTLILPRADRILNPRRVLEVKILLRAPEFYFAQGTSLRIDAEPIPEHLASRTRTAKR
jgi:hypothetical protein